MKFTVSYTLDAESQLIELWMAGPDRVDITRAENKIGRLLATNPYRC